MSNEINVKELQAERDALAAKLAELDGQEPVQYEVRTRPDWGGEWYPWERCSKEQADDYRKSPRLHDWRYEVRELFARPTTTERPVNARLLDVATGKIPHFFAGICPDAISGSNSRDPECPACRVIAAAESAPKAVRLTDGEVARHINQHGTGGWQTPSDMETFARAIETAVLRKNGIEVAE